MHLKAPHVEKDEVIGSSICGSVHFAARGRPYTQLVYVGKFARIKCHNSNSSAPTVTHGPDDGQTNFRDAIPIILLPQN